VFTVYLIVSHNSKHDHSLVAVTELLCLIFLRCSDVTAHCTMLNLILNLLEVIYPHYTLLTDAVADIQSKLSIFPLFANCYIHIYQVLAIF